MAHFSIRSGVGAYSKLPIVLVVIAALGFSALTGLAVGYAGPNIGLALVGALIGGCCFFLPMSMLMWVLMFLTVFLAGLLDYYARAGTAGYWGAVGIAIIILFRIPFEMFALGRSDRGFAGLGMSMTLVLIVLYLLLLLTTTIINGSPLDQVVSSMKNQLPYWAVTFVVASGALSKETLSKYWKALIWISVVQLPFTIHQHFFVAATRTVNADTSFDAVTGTFGGNPEGGGPNIVLVQYVLIAAILAISLMRAKSMSVGRAALIVVVSLASMLLGEVKAILILIPFNVVIVFWDVIRRSFARAIGFAIVMSAFLGVTVYAYNAMYWSSQSYSSGNFSVDLERNMEYFFDPRDINLKTGEVGRIASMALWSSDHSIDPARRFIGFGAGAAKHGSAIALGTMARKYYPLWVDATLVSQLLWEVGIIGFVLFTAIIVMACRECSKALRSGLLPPREQAQGVATLATLGTCLFLIPYSNGMLYFVSSEWLLAFTVGYAVFLHRTVKKTRLANVAVARG